MMRLLLVAAILVACAIFLPISLASTASAEGLPSSTAPPTARTTSKLLDGTVDLRVPTEPLDARVDPVDDAADRAVPGTGPVEATTVRNPPRAEPVTDAPAAAGGLFSEVTAREPQEAFLPSPTGDLPRPGDLDLPVPLAAEFPAFGDTRLALPATTTELAVLDTTIPLLPSGGALAVADIAVPPPPSGEPLALHEIAGHLTVLEEGNPLPATSAQVPIIDSATLSSRSSALPTVSEALNAPAAPASSSGHASRTDETVVSGGALRIGLAPEQPQLSALARPVRDPLAGQSTFIGAIASSPESGTLPFSSQRPLLFSMVLVSSAASGGAPGPSPPYFAFLPAIITLFAALTLRMLWQAAQQFSSLAVKPAVPPA